jgi:hypothetical protein
MKVSAAAVLILSLSVPGVVAGDAPTLPDHSLTPGDTLPVTTAQICEPGYAKSMRHVSGKVKARVYAAYGIDRDGYTIDHLVSIELGGSNDVRNLWPQRPRRP